MRRGETGEEPGPAGSCVGRGIPLQGGERAQERATGPVDVGVVQGVTKEQVLSGPVQAPPGPQTRVQSVLGGMEVWLQIPPGQWVTTGWGEGSPHCSLDCSALHAAPYPASAGALGPFLPQTDPGHVLGGLTLAGGPPLLSLAGGGGWGAVTALQCAPLGPSLMCSESVLTCPTGN